MNAITKNIEITVKNQECVAFAEGIDFQALCDHAAATAKVECGFEQPAICARRDGELFIELKSDDITAQTGAFAAILESCRITCFSSGIAVDRETGEMRCWVQLSLSYNHKDGGSNGMTLLNAWYTDREGWTFRDVR